MKLAFYIASKGTLTDKALAWWTRPGPFSHVELVFDALAPPIPPNLIDVHDAGGSLCYSSSSRAPRKGCGFQTIDLTDGKWQLFDLTAALAQGTPAMPASEGEMAKMAIADAGLPYDWAGLFKFVAPPIPDDRKARFCSEEVARLIQWGANLMPHVKAYETSPNGLARILGVIK
jgi:hypothetical protein